MSTTFKGKTITREMVLKALADFDKAYPNTNNYENWLENDAFKYALRYADRLYPPKYILNQVSRISRREFSGGDQTNRVFKQLGFEVGYK